MTSSELHQCVAVIHVRMFTHSLTLQTNKYIYIIVKKIMYLFAIESKNHF